MEIIPGNARASRRGPADYFTGTVWLDEVVVGQTSSNVRMNVVTFQPGARTAWHTHPLGQTLYVMSGVGRVQLEGQPIREIRPGDTVVIAPGERHWHGAAPDRIFSHMALQEADAQGNAVNWLEHVTDAEYGAGR